VIERGAMKGDRFDADASEDRTGIVIDKMAQYTQVSPMDFRRVCA